jgi:hypothetical protein
MKENEFREKLTALAELPAPEKLTAILEIASQNQLPEITRRAELSALENEFLALISAVIASPEKRWIRLLHAFLASHGWKADLRGSPKKQPKDLEDFRRGPKIERVMAQLKRGFELKKALIKKRGYSSDKSEIRAKLRGSGYPKDKIDAIIDGRVLHTAACLYYRRRFEPHVSVKAILNSYERFSKKMNRKDES